MMGWQFRGVGLVEHHEIRKYVYKMIKLYAAYDYQNGKS